MALSVLPLSPPRTFRTKEKPAAFLAKGSVSMVWEYRSHFCLEGCGLDGSRNRAEQWAEQWAESLTGRQTSAIYHYGPVKTALPSLMDEGIKMAIGKRLQFLYNDIRNVIEHTEDIVNSKRIEHPDTVENYDWEYVRKRMAVLIEKYGSELTEADKIR